MIEIRHNIGDRVKFGITKETAIEGIIRAVLIRAGNKIFYECIWYDGRTRKQEWIDEVEILEVITSSTLLIVGFKNLDFAEPGDFE